MRLLQHVPATKIEDHSDEPPIYLKDGTVLVGKAAHQIRTALEKVLADENTMEALTYTFPMKIRISEITQLEKMEKDL